MVTTVVLLWGLFFVTLAVVLLALAEGTRGYRDRNQVPAHSTRPRPPEF